MIKKLLTTIMLGAVLTGCTNPVVLTSDARLYNVNDLDTDLNWDSHPYLVTIQAHAHSKAILKICGFNDHNRKIIEDNIAQAEHIFDNYKHGDDSPNGDPTFSKFGNSSDLYKISDKLTTIYLDRYNGRECSKEREFLNSIK